MEKLFKTHTHFDGENMLRTITCIPCDKELCNGDTIQAANNVVMLHVLFVHSESTHSGFNSQNRSWHYTNQRTEKTEFIQETCFACGEILTARNDNSSPDWVMKQHVAYYCTSQDEE